MGVREPLDAPSAHFVFGANQQFTVEDCRRLFPPLTGVAGGVLSGLHVTQINWSNDDVITADHLLATGLTVSLDQVPSNQIDASVFSVVLEIAPPPPAAGTSATLVPMLLRTSQPLDGQITLQNANVNWNLPAGDLSPLSPLGNLLLQGISYGTFARARVRLRGFSGFTISGSTPSFIDGQALGAI